MYGETQVAYCCSFISGERKEPGPSITFRSRPVRTSLGLCTCWVLHRCRAISPILSESPFWILLPVGRGGCRERVETEALITAGEDDSQQLPMIFSRVSQLGEGRQGAR
ncbi:hypothetical protein CTAM01_09679 [Colletotrichum tamarilloi]|uniref:Uncharacterized protein n=1 Tax=Colletotrichum tamarilloi TaxID=1209934 RepID=A0ABQ9R2C5_9PEZI|nr:uncharacterized protein CTAM01_09679 [Colletotrichum tamarilloi]KAK1492728.1 hypothetical protein CTAM01_09679 [Colletotrichum tamarilloi]